MKRFFSLTLSACLALGLLAGCNSGGGGGSGGNSPMGRYVEEQLEDLGKTSGVYGLHRTADGDLVFYSHETDGEKGAFYRCVLPGGGGGIRKTEAAWLNDFIQGQQGSLKDLSEAEDGTVYLLYQNGGYATALARSVNGGAPERIEVAELAAGDAGGFIIGTGGSVSFGPEGGDETGDAAAPSPTTGPEGGEPGEGAEVSAAGASASVTAGTADGGAKYANGVIALPDGFLLLYGSDGVFRYGADGAKKAEFPGTAYPGNTAVLGGTLLLGDAGGAGMVTYDMDSVRQTGTYTYESKDFYTHVGMDELGLYLADSTGIYRQAEGGSIWERLVDGGITSLVMPNTGISGLVSDGGGGFYALLSAGEQGFRLVRYYYDENTPTNPDTELTIFSLKDNPTVRQAIGEFQRRNPNVQVNFRVAMEDDSSATAEDVIRTLNTELLGGKGPDLLLLDGLSVDAYIEKGVLADISALVEKLGGEGLMSNLMTAYERDGKIYGAPSRFGVPVMMGSGADLAGLDGLEALADALEGSAGSEPPLLWGPDDLWNEDVPGMFMRYYDVYADTFLKDGKVDQDALTRYFTLMERIDKAVKAYKPQMGDSASVTIVATAVSTGGGFEQLDSGAMMLGMDKARIHIQELGGKFSLSNILSNLSGREGYALRPLFGGDRYTPVGGIGIVASGKQQELAASFVEMLLSPTVQDKYLYDGFPVNADSLAAMVKDVTEGEDTMVDITLAAPTVSKGGERTDMGFLELCRGLKTPVAVDQVVKEAVSQQAMELSAGRTTPAQAAAAVAEKTELYLAE